MFEYEIVKKEGDVIYYKMNETSDKDLYSICYVNTKTHKYGISDSATLGGFVMHMLRTIREFIETGVYKEKGIIAVF